MTDVIFKKSNRKGKKYDAVFDGEKTISVGPANASDLHNLKMKKGTLHNIKMKNGSITTLRDMEQEIRTGKIAWFPLTLD